MEEKGVGLVHTEEYTHTRGLRKATHRSGGVGYICIFDKVGYDMRTFLSQVNVVSVFSVRARSRTGFFRFQIPFLLCLARVSFFFERESMGLFCLLGTRLVKSVEFSPSLICNPTFSISFQVSSLRPCLCNPPRPQSIIIIDSLKSSLKPL